MEKKAGSCIRGRSEKRSIRKIIITILRVEEGVCPEGMALGSGEVGRKQRGGLPLFPGKKTEEVTGTL